MASELNAGSLFNVDGLVAVVTGGATGIGLMFVKALLQNGAAKVYIAGRRKEKLDEVTSQLGDKVVGVQCDVTSKSDLQNAVSQIEKDAGYINLLVCNSGIGGPQVKQVTPETTMEEWAKSNFDTDFNEYVNTFAINTASVWYTSMAFLGLLKKGNEKANVDQTSQIIVTSSIAAFNKKAPGGWAYGQSKAAPTVSAQDMYSDESGQPGQIPATISPLRRMGDEKDMSGTFLYLASRAGGYCNGTVIVVDGGRLNNFPTTN
uniref:WGS project CBMI000000000 data, contig CS3069_c003768 n=1 Tax=Fusarium clavum TaxID=2594811 RepID=A0A090MK26_9HYPO|nr:unnamed protein product [Fusarium clavum]